MQMKRKEKAVFYLLLMASALFFIFISVSAFADVIINNGDPGTSFTGTWNVSGGPDPWNPDDPSATSLWSRNGDTYTWTFTPTDSGYHDFSMWWTEWPSRSNNIPVEITHWGGTDTLSINQQQDGGQWKFLETYPFEAGVSYDITLTAVPGGTQNYSSSADAVQFVHLPGINVIPLAAIDSISPNPALTDAVITFTGHGEDLDGEITGWNWQSDIDGNLGNSPTFTTLAPLTPGTHTITLTVVDNEATESEPVTQTLIVQDMINEIIIDNGDPDTSFTGTWNVSGGPDPFDPVDPSANSLWSRNGATYTWTFKPAVSGNYELSMWWTQYSSRSDNIPVAIEFADGGMDTQYVDQQQDGGEWNPLGTYLFIAGESYDITITAVPGGTENFSTCADAVRFYLVPATPPSITSHPSDQTVTEGATATFSVTATGSAPLSYQWQKDGANILEDATGASYTTPPTVLGDGGSLFSCVVSNATGDAVTSNAATLTVNPAFAPTITSHPSNQTVAEGETATFSVTATGSVPLSYQWQKGGSNISGATGSSYTTDPAQLGDDGALFSCVVSNAAGDVSSDAATLTVNAVVPAITSHPADQTVTEGATATFSVTATGSVPLSYQWQKNGVDISGATAASHTTDPVALGDDGAFTCMVSNAVGDVTSDAATLTVNPAIAPTITSHPSDQTATEGTTATFSVTATGSAPLSYQWQKDGVDLVGATGATYTTPPCVLGDDGAFSCVVNNAAGTVVSDAAALTVVLSEAPVAFNDRVETLVGVPVTINVVANDTDSDGTIDPTSVAMDTGPANGTAVEQGDGTVLYTPDAGYSGKDTFTYTVQDDSGVVSNTATVTVNVGIVIDNGDPQTSFTGTWTVSGGPNPWSPEDPEATSLYSRDGDTYTWTFIPDVSGNYEISMWHTYVSSRSPEVPVDIENWHGTATMYFSQQRGAGEWNSLGTYPFVAGESYDVTITALSGEERYSTCADAVRFVHIPGNVAPRATINSISPSRALPGQEVVFSGSGTDFEGTVQAFKWYSTLDGPLSDQAGFNTTTLSTGVHTIFFSVQDNDGTWSSEIQTSVDVNDYGELTTEHMFMAPGYASTDGMPVMLAALQDLGATENSSGDWEYRNSVRNKNYVIHLVTNNAELIEGLEWPDSIVGYFGHSNYGLGQLFSTQQEMTAQVIKNIRYVDDNRILNISSPVAHVNLSGMRTGQAYPNWWPIYQDGTSAIMPYEFGDPNGDPVYNYYPTYQVPGDPTHYKIETVRHSAIERFPDWDDGPAWYDPNGAVPDPTNPEHMQYYITNPEPWAPSFQRYGNWVATNILLEASGWVDPDTPVEYYRENYEYSDAGNGSDQAEWLFSIPEEGDYFVYAWYLASSSNSTESPYTVNHAYGTTTVPVNQRVNGGQWNSLGLFHFYADDYSVVLTDNVSDGRVVADGIRIEHIDNPPEILKADFNARPLSGPAPLEVYFDSEDVGIKDSFMWDFGNGVVNDTRSNQWVTYDQPGTYTVRYTISGPLGSDTTTEVDYITVGDVEPPLKAEFDSITSQMGTTPFDALFRDRSSGNIVSWEWDLDGNGSIDSTDRYPAITYTEPGAYTVTLTVKDTNGDTDTETKVNYVRIAVFDKNIDNVDYPKPHYRSKTLLGRKELELPTENFRYARLYYGGCDSAHYFTDIFQRGIFHFASGSTYDGEIGMAEYMKAYVTGKSDYEIWQILQSIEPKYDYFDFNKPPSEQW